MISIGSFELGERQLTRRPTGMEVKHSMAPSNGADDFSKLLLICDLEN